MVDLEDSLNMDEEDSDGKGNYNIISQAFYISLLQRSL
jgi:hypothetical protein